MTDITTAKEVRFCVALDILVFRAQLHTSDMGDNPDSTLWTSHHRTSLAVVMSVTRSQSVCPSSVTVFAHSKKEGEGVWLMINALAGAANAATATGFSRRSGGWIADMRWPTLTNEEGNKGIRQGGERLAPPFERFPVVRV